jgi:hypothetical protein
MKRLRERFEGAIHDDRGMCPTGLKCDSTHDGGDVNGATHEEDRLNDFVRSPPLGMTVNERLFGAGLLEKFDSAIDVGDRQAAIDLLGQVDLEVKQAAQTVETMLAEPAKVRFSQPVAAPVALGKDAAPQRAMQSISWQTNTGEAMCELDLTLAT